MKISSLSKLYIGVSYFVVFLTVQPDFAFALPSDALKGGAGTKSVSFSKIAKEKKMRLEIEEKIKMEEEIRRRVEAELAIKAEEIKNKERPSTISGVLESERLSRKTPKESESSAIPVFVGPMPDTKKTEVANEPPEIFTTPSLVILFSQKRVYFNRQLERFLDLSERSKRLVHYSVVSEIPTSALGGKRNDRVSTMYESNLRNVVDQLNQHGVQPSRISVVTKPTDTVTDQTVSIYQD